MSDDRISIPLEGLTAKPLKIVFMKTPHCPQCQRVIKPNGIAPSLAVRGEVMIRCPKGHTRKLTPKDPVGPEVELLTIDNR